MTIEQKNSLLKAMTNSRSTGLMPQRKHTKRKNMAQKIALLIRKNAFLRGASRVIDFCGTPDKEELLEEIHKQSTPERLRHDWHMVGRDMQEAFKSVRKEPANTCRDLINNQGKSRLPKKGLL